MSVEGLLSVVLVLGLCLMFHEGGHFIGAKLARMRVEEFGIGWPIPPRLFSLKRGGTVYSFYWLLIGAFVRIAGMEPGQEDAADGFYAKSVWRRGGVLLAGPALNIVLAGLFFWTLGAFYGELTELQNVVAKVLPGEPAEAAGIRPGDRIVAIDEHWHSTTVAQVDPDGPGARLGLRAGDIVLDVDGTEVTDYEDMVRKLSRGKGQAVLAISRRDEDGVRSARMPRVKDPDGALAASRGSLQAARLPELGATFEPLEWRNTVALTQEHGGQEMTLTVQRDGRLRTFTMTPKKVLVKSPVVSDDGKISIEPTEIGRIGITPVGVYRRMGPVASARWGAEQTAAFIKANIAYFALLVRGKAQTDFVGPIGIAKEIGESAKLGFSSVLQIGGFISLIIGILNLAPFPGLDGWRLMSTAYEAVLGRPPNRKREALVNAIGMTILVVALIAVCFKDAIEIIVQRSVE